MFDLASRTRRIARCMALCGLALSLSMCAREGTETDNPLIDFDATECKHGSALSLAPAVARTQAALEMPAEEYANLFCYAWQVEDGGTVTFDVVNYSGGCGVEWAASETRVDGERVDLGIRNPSCAVAACGSCSYDFTFEVAGLVLDAPAEVRIVEAGCNGQPDEASARVVLPIDGASEGVRCRMLSGGFLPECGGLRERPCPAEGVASDESYGTCSEGRCDDGFTCVAAAYQDQDFCFTSCEDDDDCPLAIESCQDGACRLRETL